MPQLQETLFTLVLASEPQDGLVHFIIHLNTNYVHI